MNDTPYRSIIGDAIDIFSRDFKTIIEIKLRANDWKAAAINGLAMIPDTSKSTKPTDDFHFCFQAFLSNWDAVFSQIDPTTYTKTLLFEIRYYRNRWAHQGEMNARLTYRCLDSMGLFLDATGKCFNEKLEAYRQEMLIAMLSHESCEKMQIEEVKAAEYNIINDTEIEGSGYVVSRSKCQ